MPCPANAHIQKGPRYVEIPYIHHGFWRFFLRGWGFPYQFCCAVLNSAIEKPEKLRFVVRPDSGRPTGQTNPPLGVSRLHPDTPQKSYGTLEANVFLFPGFGDILSWKVVTFHV